MNSKATMLNYRENGKPGELADLEAQRDNMIKANCVYRTAVKMGIDSYENASLNDLLTISKNCELDYTTSLFVDAINWTPAYAFEQAPFGGYSMSNLDAKILRVSKEIAGATQ